LKRADAERVKGCISCTVDNYRSPYDRVSRDHPRQCVFVGTTNEPEWINDVSGGRRFWPVQCTEDNLVNIEYIEENRSQLFAEAVARFKTGESWWEMPESALIEQEARRMADAWENPIREWLLGHPEPVSIIDVWTAAFEKSIEHITMQDQKRIANCLRVAGRTSHHTREGNVWQTPVKGGEPSQDGTVHA